MFELLKPISISDIFTENGEYKLNSDYKEILKLKQMLEDNGIPHELIRNMDGWQVCYPQFEKFKCSAIETFASYGRHQDLIEIMGLFTKEENEAGHGGVIGYLTAEDVFKRIKADYEKEKENE